METSCGCGTDLEVHAWEQGGEIRLVWLYNRDLFDGWRMEQMARHYVRVLEAVAAEAGQADRGDRCSGSRGAAEDSGGVERLTERAVPEATSVCRSCLRSR